MLPEQEALVLSHRNLVAFTLSSMAVRWYRDQDGLTGAANLGLVQAASRYSPDRGVRFVSYALLVIRGAVLDEIRSAYPASRGSYERVSALQSAMDDLTAELHREPSAVELAERLGWTRAAVESVRLETIRVKPSSLELLLDAGFEAGHNDGPEFAYDEAELTEALRRSVEALRPNQRQVFRGVYYQARRQDDIAVEMQLTSSRVSQILKAAIAELGKVMQSLYADAA